MQGWLRPSGGYVPAYPSSPGPKVGSLRHWEEVAPMTRSKTQQGGEGLRAGPSWSRPEAQLDGGDCGASGAAPRDGTARSRLEMEGFLDLDEIESRPVQDPKRDGRARWTEDENVLIMRAHFIAKTLEQMSERTYRQLLTETWNDIKPGKQLYTNLLANRVRYLLENGKLSSVELAAIEQNIWPQTAPPAEEKEQELNQLEELQEEQQEEDQDDPQTRKMKRIFGRNTLLYSGINPEARLKIPRMKGSRIMLEKVRMVDAIIKSHISSTTTLRDIVDLVYTGAATVCEGMGKCLTEPHRKPKKEQPPWRARLERKVLKIRKNFGLLHTYLNTEVVSNKVHKAVRRIASEVRINLKASDSRMKLETLNDHLKQKIKALGNRIKRYTESKMRYENNQLYYKNQKQFFRNLENTNNSDQEPPKTEDMYTYWQAIWGNNKQHDDTARWIRESEAESSRYNMEEIEITKLDIEQRALTNPTVIPGFFTLGTTIMFPKGNTTSDPKNFRPITCLPTIYKLLTGTITKYIWNHVKKENILAREQNGCCRDAKGCKELLVVDQIITGQAKGKLRNISIAWVDYRKAFDSVPHTWLLKTMRLYGISDKVINLLEHLMSAWRTTLLIDNRGESSMSKEIAIKCGIFQGDTLSPLWFCLALNLLSKLLNKSKYGYIINKTRNCKINHQLYMDDLKLFAANREEMRRLLEIVSSFSQTIGMEMRLDKCAVLDVKRGRVAEGPEIKLWNESKISCLGPQETYKYLGIQQALDIKTPEVKDNFKTKYFARLRSLLKAKLNSKALFTAINIWVLPCITYSFGLVRWTAAELQAIDIQTRKLLTRYGIHHPHSSVNRLYISRHEGGRGLQNILITHNKIVSQMRDYFRSRNLPLFKIVCQADEYSALQLAKSSVNLRGQSLEQLSEEWHSKALHGRYPGNLKSDNIIKNESLTYLKAGYLHPETEGRLIAIQDQLYWDTAMVTDRSIAHNRPDIVLFNKTEKSVQIIDVSVPADDNITKAYTEKVSKYHDLAFELKIYGLRKTSIVPLIISVNGLVEAHMLENTKRLQLDTYLISQAQKQVILGTTRIVRKFLTIS
ncbi:uncharacterized protein LOC123683063 [Harmonia axyridis]|uniref:uncharacterized protein LOC123683063 n=1 Tax=Harmonia axyridis TaxID=115357 RepID=UPI001E276C54|nr:uncharacterized protein LOC123683063 [Harmonia axyridis]